MQRTFHHNSISIFYRTEGDGIPVVLLHGFGEDGSVWDEQANFLKRHCKVIVPDFPGSGHSIFLNDDPAASSIEYYADGIHALLKDEHIFSCIMLGHSFGGYVTLAFAEKYAELLKGFGLIHSTAFPDSEEKKQNRLKGINVIEEYGSYTFLKNTIPGLFGATFKKKYPGKVEALISNANNFSKNALQHYYRAMGSRPDRTNVLQNSEVPVLFVIGTEDVPAPMQDVLQQVHLPKIAYIHIFENTGHMGMLELPERMNRVLLEFIQGII